MPRIGLPDIHGQFKFDTGTATDPSMAFREDTDTGIYTDTDDTLSFSTDGTRRFSILPDGSIEFVDISAPGATTNKLYTVSGNLFFNGSQVATGSGGVQNPMTANLDVGGYSVHGPTGNGTVTITGGPAFNGNDGGELRLYSGDSANAPTGSGGDLTIKSGDGIYGSGSGKGGNILIESGTSSPGYGGGEIKVQPGINGASYSALLKLYGSDSTLGTIPGGTILIKGGSTTGGHGGSVSITGTDGAGTNRNGGNVTLQPGSPTGSGTSGDIKFEPPGGGTEITFRVGTGAPTHTPQNGSFYIRTDGATNTTLYVRVSGAWVGIA